MYKIVHFIALDHEQSGLYYYYRSPAFWARTLGRQLVLLPFKGKSNAATLPQQAVKKPHPVTVSRAMIWLCSNPDPRNPRSPERRIDQVYFIESGFASVVAGSGERRPHTTRRASAEGGADLRPFFTTPDLSASAKAMRSSKRSRAHWSMIWAIVLVTISLPPIC